MNTIRRLAAILVADVAGYSRLMGADEEGTRERLSWSIRRSRSLFRRAYPGATAIPDSSGTSP